MNAFVPSHWLWMDHRETLDRQHRLVAFALYIYIYPDPTTKELFTTDH